jgi:hypothetical protein
MPESLAGIMKQQFIRPDQTLLSSSSSLFFWRIKKPHQLWSSDSCSEDEDTTGTCWSWVLFGVQVLISLVWSSSLDQSLVLKLKIQNMQRG